MCEVCLSTGPGAHEPSQLLLRCALSLCGLLLHDAQGGQLTFRVNDAFDLGHSQASDQLVFEVRLAHEEPEALDVVAREVAAEARTFEAATEVGLLPLVAQSRERDIASALAQELSEVG